MEHYCSRTHVLFLLFAFAFCVCFLQLVKMPLSQYFEERGEEEFREAETLVLDRVSRVGEAGAFYL